MSSVAFDLLTSVQPWHQPGLEAEAKKMQQGCACKSVRTAYMYCMVGALSFDFYDLNSGSHIKPHAMMSMCAEDTPATARGMTCMSVLPFPS